MHVKGSITIFFTLIMSVIFSLMGSLLLSAKVGAGRAQIAMAADQTLYSAMAKYDRMLFETYHLLYIDGGYGTETLQLGRSLDEMKQDMSYLLTPKKGYELRKGSDFLSLELKSGSISGYTLATDCQGRVFLEQAVSYMKDTVGVQGISLLSQKLKKESDTLDSQNTIHKNTKEEGTMEDYEKIKNEEGRETEDGIDDNQEIIENGELAKDIMDSIGVVRKTSLLQLVLPTDAEVSVWSADQTELLRNRQMQTGMGYLEVGEIDANGLESLLFQEYMIQNLNFYGEERHAAGPQYGVEWILFEKTSDIENLEKMVNRLFLIREAANTASLYNDKMRYEQVETYASALAAVLKAPVAQPVLKAALILAWAFAESVVDVHGLLAGKKIPIIKNADGWQVEFCDIFQALQDPESSYRDKGGMDYEDYLRLLLFSKTQDEQILGCMEVIELSMREFEGKEHFSMNCALDSLEAEFEIEAERYKTFQITEKRSYRQM